MANKRKNFTTYHNDINLIGMKDWTANEQNFFFSILTRSKDRGTDEIKLSKPEILELAGYKNREIPRLKDTLEKLSDHVSCIRFVEKTRLSKKYIPLFSYFEIKWNDEETEFDINIQLSPHYEYVLNKLNVNFTTFELEEFLSLTGTYAKTLYRLLKQYRKVGQREFRVDEFKMLLGIPDSYKPCNITQKVMKPCISELELIFKGLEVETLRKKGVRGNPLEGYRFVWVADQSGNYLSPEAYKEKMKKIKYREKIEKELNSPEWYNHTPTEKVTPEDIEAVMEMMKSVGIGVKGIKEKGEQD